MKLLSDTFLLLANFCLMDQFWNFFIARNFLTLKTFSESLCRYTEPSILQNSLNSSSSLNETSVGNEAPETEFWRPLLLMIPLILGENTLDSKYFKPLQVNIYIRRRGPSYSADSKFKKKTYRLANCVRNIQRVMYDI